MALFIMFIALGIYAVNYNASYEEIKRTKMWEEVLNKEKEKHMINKKE